MLKVSHQIFLPFFEKTIFSGAECSLLHPFLQDCTRIGEMKNAFLCSFAVSLHAEGVD